MTGRAVPAPEIRVLLVDDDPEDHLLTSELLADVEEGGRTFVLDATQSYDEALAALQAGGHDVYLLDYRLGERNGVELLREAREAGCRAPIILLTGEGGIEADIAAMEAGADDYLVKGQIDGLLLDRAIRYAIERRRLEQRLLEAEKLETLAVLAGGLAHDFNNLLVGVLGNATVLRERVGADDDARAKVEQIELAARRAAELTNQMLAYTSQGRFFVQPLRLSSLVEELGALLDGAVAGNADLRRELGPTALVEGDPTQLRQVVLNLVTNASEALGEGGGTIAVRTRNLGADRRLLDELELGADGAGDAYVVLEVEDDGCGMDAETRARLFDPFFTTKLLGRGLGLAATLGIVRNHGGGIAIRSAPGEGSTFTVVLPAAAAAPAPSAAPGAGGLVTAAADAHVLVVDDEELACATATVMLEVGGMNVTTARSGEEALRLIDAAAAPFDVVLLDLTMPGLGGAETLRRLAAGGLGIPVVLTSGYSETEVTDLTGVAGYAGFLHKPYTHEQLLERISGALENGRAAAQPL
jgi:signal transduction histidine kinase